MSPNNDQLGLPSRSRMITELARDVSLNLVGMESISGVADLDLQRLQRDVIASRDTAIIDRLGDTIRFMELATEDSLTIASIEERIPHAAVLVTFYTAAALHQAWQAVEQAAGQPKE